MATMYKIFLIGALTFACAHAYQQTADAHAETTKHDVQLEHDGSYKYAFATSNGITAQESGTGGKYADGSYSYYSPEGQLIQLQYVADEHGFQPQAAHLPTPPPIPAAILKSLEYIRSHPQYEEAAGAAHSHYQHEELAPVYHHPIEYHQSQRRFAHTHKHK